MGYSSVIDFVFWVIWDVCCVVQPMEQSSLKNSDVLILTGLTQIPTANPDGMLGEFCSNLGEFQLPAWFSVLCKSASDCASVVQTPQHSTFAFSLSQPWRSVPVGTCWSRAIPRGSSTTCWSVYISSWTRLTWEPPLSTSSPPWPTARWSSRKSLPNGTITNGLQ